MTEHELPLAEYLSGELDAEQTAAVDEHLVTCDACWSEVHMARLGQLAAQRTTEIAPHEVRRRVLAQVAGATGPTSDGARLRRPFPARGLPRHHRRFRVSGSRPASPQRWARRRSSGRDC